MPLQSLNIQPALLQRGFWVYVWEIIAQTGDRFYYVGRTGDSSSVNAQSPMGRVSGHLGTNENANQIRKHVLRRGHNLEDCKSLELVAFGPIFEETKDKGVHRDRRDQVGALERNLCRAMREVGYGVLNDVKSRKTVAPDLWQKVLGEFRARFPKLHQ